MTETIKEAETVDLRSYQQKKHGFWMEPRSKVPAMFCKDGLLVWFRKQDVEELMDASYIHRQERDRKVWYFNKTRDREIAEMERDDDYVVCNPQVYYDHFRKV